MLQHLKGYQRSITLIKTGRLNKKGNTNINKSPAADCKTARSALSRTLIN